MWRLNNFNFIKILVLFILSLDNHNFKIIIDMYSYNIDISYLNKLSNNMNIHHTNIEIIIFFIKFSNRKNFYLISDLGNILNISKNWNDYIVNNLNPLIYINYHSKLFPIVDYCMVFDKYDFIRPFRKYRIDIFINLFYYIKYTICLFIYN